jgi:GTPase SAR1 family protein
MSRIWQWMGYTKKTSPTGGADEPRPPVSPSNDTFRIALLGTSGVGKSTFLMASPALMGPEGPLHTILCDDVLFHVSDGLYTGDNVDAYLIMYDITDWNSFLAVAGLKELVNADKPILVVGNKSDCRDRRKVYTCDACLYNLPFLEISALTGENVRLVYWKLQNEIKKRGP